MKSRLMIFIFMIFVVMGCTNASFQSNTNLDNSEKTEKLYNKFIEDESPNIAQLTLFFTSMPKGGDLHHHYSGSIYAETYLEWADEEDIKINRDTLKGRDGNVSVEDLRKDEELYRKLLSQWSDKDYENHFHLQDPPDLHFFNTFGYFGSVSKTDTAELKKGLKALKTRAIKENVLYIESMLKTIKYSKDKADFRLIIKEYDVKLREEKDYDKIASLLDKLSLEIEKELLRLSSTAPNYENPVDEFIGRVEEAHKGIDDERFMMRYQTFASRNSPPSEVFLALYSAFKASNKSELLVGVNIVGPENGVVAIEDYTLHMHMFRYLKDKFPKVNRSLHAGELVLGMVRPKNLKFHINQAVDLAGAERIGHGIGIFYEEEAVDLLRKMKEETAVEINLTSNEFILGVKDQEHPYLIYSAAGVPLVISTDDSGVSRNNLSKEYVLLASRYKPDYSTIKKYVYNSIEYSFLPREEKNKLTNSLDLRFEEFEMDMAEYFDLIESN